MMLAMGRHCNSVCFIHPWLGREKDWNAVSVQENLGVLGGKKSDYKKSRIA